MNYKGMFAQLFGNNCEYSRTGLWNLATVWYKFTCVKINLQWWHPLWNLQSPEFILGMDFSFLSKCENILRCNNYEHQQHMIFFFHINVTAIIRSL